MFKHILSGALLVSLTMAAANRPAAATERTLDTFDFADNGVWSSAVVNFFGTFAGYVDPGGYIELGDLTSFSADYNQSTPSFFLSLADLSNFSYNVTGGAGSLDFIASSASLAAKNVSAVCVGFVATLAPGCNPDGGNPSETRVDIVLQSPFSVANYVTSPPVITLDSSVTSVPETQTWVMLMMGLAGIGLARASARKTQPRRADQRGEASRRESHSWA